jgi:hypothetical protein
MRNRIKRSSIGKLMLASDYSSRQKSCESPGRDFVKNQRVDARMEGSTTQP